MICEKVKAGQIKLPMLGICYGFQMITHIWGGKVAKGESAEYGLGEVELDNEDDIFKNVPKKFRAWVSHFDEVKKLPDGFVKLAHSTNSIIEAAKHETMPIFCVQFHPEVWHTEHGERILRNFLEISNSNR
jgi:GMP synthase (glutamine-hydrolysing)